MYYIEEQVTWKTREHSRFWSVSMDLFFTAIAQATHKPKIYGATHKPEIYEATHKPEIYDATREQTHMPQARSQIETKLTDVSRVPRYMVS